MSSIDEAFVKHALAVLELESVEARVPHIVEQLRRIQAVAAGVLAYPLDPADELAPVWTPRAKP